MGRVKLAMKLVDDEKSKKTIFSKRKNGLKKKAIEFGILCGVDTLLICYGLQGGTPETWPENPSSILPIIQRFRSLGREDREKRKLDLASYLEKMISGAKRELEQNQKKNDLILHLSWDDRLDGFSEVQLRNLVDFLDSERQKLKQRIHNTGMEKSFERNPIEIFHKSKQNQLNLLEMNSGNHHIQDYVPFGFPSPCFDIGSDSSFQSLDHKYLFAMERSHAFTRFAPLSFSPPPVDLKPVHSLDNYYDRLLRTGFPAQMSDHRDEIDGTLSVPLFKRSGGLLSDVVSPCISARMEMLGDDMMSNNFEF